MLILHKQNNDTASTKSGVGNFGPKPTWHEGQVWFDPLAAKVLILNASDPTWTQSLRETLGAGLETLGAGLVMSASFLLQKFWSYGTFLGLEHCLKVNSQMWDVSLFGFRYSKHFSYSYYFGLCRCRNSLDAYLLSLWKVLPPHMEFILAYLFFCETAPAGKPPKMISRRRWPL